MYHLELEEIGGSYYRIGGELKAAVADGDWHRIQSAYQRLAAMSQNERDKCLRNHHPWVARIVGFDKKFGFEREFLKGRPDYTNSRKDGNRGVKLCFVLDKGYYEINRLLDGVRSVRNFTLVTGFSATKVSEDEVRRCLARSTA